MISFPFIHLVLFLLIIYCAVDVIKNGRRHGPLGRSAAAHMRANQLTVVCFPSVPSNGVAGLEPPPPPPPFPWQGFKTSAGMSMCTLVSTPFWLAAARGRGPECMDGKERGERVMGGGGVPLKEHCLADNTAGCAGIIRAGFTVRGALSQTG